MPMDRSRYPANWKEIRAAILEREGHRCKFCGVANHAIGARDKAGAWHDQRAISAMNATEGEIAFGGAYPKIIRIVLTVAHLDHDTTNNAGANLAALCQRCHLRYDQEHHAINAAATRRRRKEERQPPLPGVE